MSLTAFLGGVGGSIVNRIADRCFSYFEKKQQIEIDKMNNAHEIELLERQHNYKMESAQLQQDTIEMEREFDIELSEIQESYSGMRASYEHDTNSGSASQWVVNLIRSTRPFLTIMLAVSVIVLSFYTKELSQLTTLHVALIDLLGVSVGWWFGDRGFALKKKAGL